VTTPIDLADAVDPSVAGGKAAGLAALVRAGFPVPSGIVIPWGAAVDADGLWQRLGGSTVAVRSSGIAEDGADVSLAGAFDTVLGVDGPAALADAIAAVRLSSDGPRAVAAGMAGAPLAVLVQRQVAALVAGVAFTADPVTGSRRVIVVGAVAGTGVELVDGTADGDEWRVVDGRVVPVRDRLGVLDANRAVAVAALAQRVEATRGGPQDLEWAWDGSTTWVLQARPMTGLPHSSRRRRRRG